MWKMLLDRMLTQVVRDGTLRLTLPDGTTRIYGSGEPELGLKINDPGLFAKVVLEPTLAVGEAYMDKRFEIENDDLKGFFYFMFPRFFVAGETWMQRPVDLARFLTRRWRQFAPEHKARANVTHHYDLSDDLFALFLDEDWQYSCAYFPRPGMSLEEAQVAKKDLIARKLLIEPGMRVLDIGCGWGGLALTLAREFGAEVVGVTLSQHQHARARERVRAAGLEGQVDIRLTDYREVTEQFDRIVSVGMFEHVGVPQYNEFFRFVDKALTDDGLALIHSIGHVGPPNESDPWITKYIFPGGYTPSLCEMQRAIDKQGLVTCDIESWRIHYADTLWAWYERFMANADKARALYDERFVRMWRYYLLSMEASFRVGKLLVYQAQLGKKLDAAPVTRDYLYHPTANRTGS